MTLNQLEYFLSVVETGSFTKAAKRNFIAQTAISQQIKALESEIGFHLLIRDNRSVEVTPAGKSFYEDISQMFKSLERALDKARRISQKSVGGYLRIGYLGNHESKFLPEIVNALHKCNPDLEIMLSQRISRLYGEDIENDNVDVNFAMIFPDYPPPREGHPDIAEKIFVSGPWCAVLNPEHRLVGRKKLYRYDLKDEKIVMIDPAVGGTYVVESSIKKCEKCGFTPTFLMTKGLDESFKMVEAGLCVGIFPLSCKRGDERLIYIPLSGDNEQVNTVVQWSHRNKNPAVMQFLEIIDKMSGN